MLIQQFLALQNLVEFPTRSRFIQHLFTYKATMLNITSLPTMAIGMAFPYMMNPAVIITLAKN
jgi:hypothetical protein